MSAANLSQYLAGLRAEGDAALERVLAASAAPPIIAEPMRYPLAGSGKRLRPCLDAGGGRARERAACTRRPADVPGPWRGQRPVRSR